MFMVLAKSVEEMQHIENIVAYICGAAVLVTCAILFAIFAEKRVSAYESRQMLIEENRLQRSKNEVEREKENFRSIDIEMKKENERLRQENAKLKKDNSNYKQQLDEIELGTFNGRSLKHA